MMDARKHGLLLGEAIGRGDDNETVALIAAMVVEIERLQGLAKRGHGREFIDGNGRFDVV